MKIVVLVKEVPDTYGARTLDLETGLANRATAESVVDEIGERALEVALAYADAHTGTEVRVLSMGPDTATASIRKCLAMGASCATHVADPGLVGADLGLTAEVLGAAVQREGFDLVIAGNQSTDGMGGVLPAMLAEVLQVPNATNLGSLEIQESTVSGVRSVDGAKVAVSVTLPAVISVTEELPEARFPNFKGIMAAKKKQLTVVTLEELGIDPEDMSVSRGIMLGIDERPPRKVGTQITDDGTAAAKLAAFLVDNHLV